MKLFDASWYPLLDHLAADLPAGSIEWEGWRIQRMTGGWNNLLFRATSSESDLVIKFARRDERDRAGREFYALALMQKLAPGLAPAPVLFDRERYSHQVIVQQRVEGETREAPPQTPLEWQRLAGHYAAIHTVTPEQAGPDMLAILQPAALTFNRAADAVHYVIDVTARKVQAAWTDDLRGLLNQLEQARFPTWPKPPCTFARCDPNIANFLSYPDDRPWVSVDWENSGWGDPAFEIGDLMTHPCYKAVAPEQWDEFLKAYIQQRPADSTFLLRARVYYAVILVRWTCLYAGYAWQHEQGAQDTGRLVAWPQSWWEEVPFEYRRYLRAAQSALAGFSPSLHT